MSEADLPEIGEINTSVDPRDFFRSTIFQKRGQQLDPDKSHQWNRAPGGGFWAENSYGTILTAETYTPFKDRRNEWGILIAEGTTNGLGTSVYSADLNQDTRGRVADTLRMVASCFPDELRHLYTKEVIAAIPTLGQEEFATIKLTRMALEMLPDANTSTVVIPEFWQGFEAQPSARQQRLMVDFMHLVARKMNVRTLQDKLVKMADDWRTVQDPVGYNFQSIFSDATNWVLKSRSDTEIDYSLMNRPDPKPFTVKDQVRRTFKDQNELLAILLAMPHERSRDVLTDSAVAEIVPLELVCGGPHMPNWTVSQEEGRGPGRIFELARRFSTGASVTGTDQPICVTEVDGKYFVGNDGRHRTAALKALGVQAVPMLVSHAFK